MASKRGREPREAGKSSYELIDMSQVLAALSPREGSTILDVGCGRGQYALDLARVIGPRGLVHAVDLWEDGIAKLREAAMARNLNHIDAFVGDMGELASITDGSVDLCLMATVLHDLVQAGTVDQVLTEIVRVLKPVGRLAVIEFKKIDGPPGPPLRIRLAPHDVEGIVAPYDLAKERFAEIGPCNYLIRCVVAPGFRKSRT
jgi:ubiquinone/menaquinone biosynthesis C-methylase UbiE